MKSNKASVRNRLTRRGVLRRIGLTTGIGLIGAYGFAGSASAHFDIDVKPNSDPSSFNINSNGVVPVALLYTTERNITPKEIYRCLENEGPSSVHFGPPDVVHVNTDTYEVTGGSMPVRWSFEDVNGDGYKDLLLHFETQSPGIQAFELGDDVPAEVGLRFQRKNDTECSGAWSETTTVKVVSRGGPNNSNNKT